MTALPERITNWYDIPATVPISTILERHLELHMRVTMARGACDPTVHGNPCREPLTPAEWVELLALGECIARTVRHPADVHHALQDGVSWYQIAEAVGQGEQEARQAYRAWADGQRNLHEHYGDIGMPPGEHAEALIRAADLTGGAE
ncbi:hypothetical protein [Streptosporangium sp. NPDC006007]|uniref:hypothetical protein n=1 Tax=Streptosporangium sp. NPDC006007 TaxID=3154575 RepID=UPI0033A221CB